MTSSTEVAPDIRVCDVHVSDDRLIVDLMDGRSIAMPIAWYPRVLRQPAHNGGDGKSRAVVTAFTGLILTRT
jgi:hypothetical protein